MLGYAEHGLSRRFKTMQVIGETGQGHKMSASPSRTTVPQGVPATEGRPVNGQAAHLCSCPEPPAHGEDWPDNMHVHEGCRVYHRFKDCAIGQGVLPLK